MVKNNHVLIHRSKNERYWAFPGGRVQLGEDSIKSIKREMMEELGLEVKVERLLWLVENFFKYEGRDYHEIGMYYLVSDDKSSDEIDTTPFYGLEGDRLIYQWIPIDSLEEMNLQPVMLKKELLDIPLTTKHIIQR